MTTATQAPDLSSLGRIFAEPSAYADPAAWHAAAKRLREEAPIIKVSLPDYPGFYAVTKHADVMEIERNPEVFTNAPVPALATISERQDGGDNGMKTLVQMDGDEHRAHRIIVNEWFKPRNVRKMTERVEELAKQYVDQMQATGGEIDFAKEIATHFPLQVILSIFGLPESDNDKMLKLTQELFGAEDPDIGRAGEDASVLSVMMDFYAYFTGLAADRRANPTDDLASVIANAELNGAPLPDMDVFGFYLIICTAGHDTTSNSLAGGLLGLIENPDQLALMKEHPELIDDAANELIRFVSPVKHFIRTCQAPFTVRDTTFQPGDVALLSYASANRDDEVFPDPFKLDIKRENAGSHLAFGFGPHFCLGAHLARLEVRSLFKELVRRVDTIELAAEPTFVQSRLVSGPKTLPVRYTWR
jgi:cytochrome P450